MLPLAQILITEEIDLPLAVGILAQMGFIVAGLFLFWRLVISEKFRAARERPSPLVPWMVTGTDFFFGALIIIGIGVAGNAAGMWLAGTLGVDEELLIVFQGGGFQGGMLIGALISVAYIKQRQTAAGIEQPISSPPPLNIWIGGGIALLVAFPPLTGINLAWTGALNAMGLDTTQQELVDIFRDLESTAALLGMIFLAVVVAPLTEEVIFRAGLFRYLRTRTPRWVAFCLPAGIFAMMHGNLVAFGPLFGIGLVFAFAYERTGRIAVPIIAHGLFNLNTLVLLLAGLEV